MKRVTAIWMSLLGMFPAAGVLADIVQIAATDGRIRVTVEPVQQRLDLVELGVWEADDAPGKVIAPVTAGLTDVHLPRQNSAGGDRLYRRFVLRGPEGNVGAPQWVTDLSGLPRSTADLTWPESIKGVSCPVGTSDLVELGIKHIHTNITLGEAFLAPGKTAADPTFIIEHDGYTYHLNKAYFERVDREFQELTAAEINIVAVILNPFLKDPALTKALTHPDADQAGHYSAFRIDNADSAARYTAFLHFFVKRYTQEGFPNGRLGGMIIGNEVDSHWTWHNMGPTDLPTLAVHHASELRLASLATRAAHPTLPIFISLTHSWTWPNSMDMSRNVAAKDLLDTIADIGKRGGDFDWHVAYHPYPKNLFVPSFWNDSTAVFAYDSPMITFKNIEVLADYMTLEPMQFEGKSRRLILSEQGLDAGRTPESERLQAAALALAWKKINAIDAIDALIIHRHLDHPNEGGLRLGLLAFEGQKESEMFDPAKQRRRPAWHVYQAADTPEFDAVAEPFLSMITPEQLAAATAPETPFPAHAPLGAGQQQQGDDIVVNLAERAGDARVSNQLAWNRQLIDLPDGGVRDALMLHPSAGKTPDAEAAFELDLPAEKALQLRFTTGKTKAGGDGYTAAILVNGKQLWQHTQPDQAMADHQIDLSPYAGKTITLTFRVGKNKNEAYDNALFISPRIVRAEEE